jgi:hypothetical protein
VAFNDSKEEDESVYLLNEKAPLNGIQQSSNSMKLSEKLLIDELLASVAHRHLNLNQNAKKR